MMNIKRTVFTLLTAFLAILFLFPGTGFAVDFSNTKVDIEAFLQENGQVNVTESHTYSFDGEFNGITREVVPKEGARISQLKATENGKSLKVEKDEDLYKIYRKGEDESITIVISYTIEDGVDVYSDVAEFYWPFFDDRNESTYESMNITIVPPKETTDVIAFGYDEAFDTEKIQSDGSVLYQMGEVPYEENGDIRVTYPATLFPTANITADKSMKDQIIKEQIALYDEAAAWAQRKDDLHTLSVIIVSAFTIMTVLFIVFASMKARTRKIDVEREMKQAFFVPEETLSIPATIYFTKGILPTEATAAALLDLVRKGYVVKIGDDRFQLRNRAGMLKHEQILTAFLFDEVGDNGEFSFEDLKAYTSRKKNHQKYHSKITEWQQAVMKEVKEKSLYEKKGKLRWTFGILGFLQIVFSIYVLTYDLVGWFFAFFGLSIIYLILALVYRPRTWDGLAIIHGWRLMKERLPGLSDTEWEALTDDDQMRAYIYGIGSNDKAIIEKNKELVQSFNPINVRYNRNDWDATAVNMSTLYIIGPMASSHFHSAHKTTESTINSSSSSSSGGGGGAGGGGGGSGAF